MSAAFGVAGHRLGTEPAKVLGEMSEQEAKASHDVSLIMDDMHAYFERRRFMRFKTVLDDMRQQDVVGSLRQLGDDVKKENGLSIAQCEFWSDTLDRWAEDLVDPAVQRHLQRQVQEQPSPGPGAGGPPDPGRRSQPARGDARCPSRPRPLSWPTISSSRA